jgi:hypothetical protein
VPTEGSFQVGFGRELLVRKFVKDMSDPGWLADTQLSSSVDSVDFYVSCLGPESQPMWLAVPSQKLACFPPRYRRPSVYQ